jgi:hypothetical protein
MKKLNQGIGVLIAVVALLGAGCVVHEDNGGGGCTDCGDSSGWYTLTPDTTLMVGEECPVTCLPDLCSGYLDTDVYYDTLYLSDIDYGLDEIRLNYAVENLGYDTTDVYVTLCDTYGCEEVASLPALLPGEYYQESINSDVLRSAMEDFYDCLDGYGDYCSMYYDIDVYIDQDGTCSATSFNYFFEGYYLW